MDSGSAELLPSRLGLRVCWDWPGHWRADIRGARLPLLFHRMGSRICIHNPERDPTFIFNFGATTVGRSHNARLPPAIRLRLRRLSESYLKSQNEFLPRMWSWGQS